MIKAVDRPGYINYYQWQSKKAQGLLKKRCWQRSVFQIKITLIFIS
jgi:hypothetical protein